MLGEIIFFYRNKHGITQEELASGICSISYLSKLENGKIHPNKDIIRDLFNKLGLSLEDIVEEEKQLISLLEELKELILSRRADLATQKKKEIEMLIANKMVNPTVLRSNFILEIGFQLLTKNVQRATEVHSTVEVFVKYLTIEQKYLYHKYTGLLYYESNDMVRCLEELLVGLDIGENNHIIRPDLYYQLALAYSRLYQVPICVYYAEKALTLFDQASDYIRSTECKILLGINHNRLSNFQKAESYLRSALKFANSYGTPHLSCIVLHNLGFLYSARGDRKIAINYYLESLKIRNESDVNRYLNTLYYLAKEYYSSNQQSTAIEWILRVWSLPQVGMLNFTR
ncbi:helix-turn-helix transcriptional regulator [Brevibacillus nitrificans]|uniref:helix-turn-helix domain-containing protein n=1 Tax=Brevibacillus nitrificans TaxID=651560 RepID=UPI0028545F03|nr:helix-turn-helix transcriptional regulator [Brevibacillus nitrificans]MDR7317018.1 transcriptional regulator with XRE-family HTH domain [Brevibacillus nitrificans]